VTVGESFSGVLVDVVDRWLGDRAWLRSDERGTRTRTGSRVTASI
jgi:hypothetical protein